MSIKENYHIFTMKFSYLLVEFIQAKLRNIKVHDENIFILWEVYN